MVNRETVKTDIGNIAVKIKEFPSPYNSNLIHFLGVAMSMDNIYVVKDNLQDTLNGLTDAINAHVHIWLMEQIKEIKDVSLNE